MKIVRYYQTENSDLREKILDLWQREKAMPASVAESRIKEVLFVALDENEQAVAVCSAQIRYLEELRGNFLYYRAFTANDQRQSNLSQSLFNTTYEYFNKAMHYGTQHWPVSGLYVVIENQELNSASRKYVMEDYSNLTLLRFNKQGQKEMAAFFKEAHPIVQHQINN